MARSPTGSVTVRGSQYFARITMPDGRRARLPLGPVADMSLTEARRRAVVLSDAYRSGRAVLPAPKRPPPVEGPAPDTVEAWWRAWFDTRAKLSNPGSDRSRYTKHIRPVLGPLAMATVTREQLERFVELLDDKAARGEIAPKTATNIWSHVQAMFRDASRSKVLAHRVRADDPTAEVAPPDSGDDKARVYLYPNEASQLLGCEDVPLERRRLYAVAAYSGLRASELAALRWEDVDLAADVLEVTKAIDRSNKRARSTKNHETRRVPIASTLRPLLEQLRQRTGPVLTVPVSKLAEAFRADLHRAGLRRPSLFERSATRKPMTFHDLRATAITWWCLEALPLYTVMRRAGHKTTGTTMGYVREAEAVGKGVGLPFPPLPASLAKRPFEKATVAGTSVDTEESLSHLGDLNPKKPPGLGTNTEKQGGSTLGFGGVSVPFPAPVADWRDRFGALVDKLERAALEGACVELRAVANDVVEAWRAA